MLLRFQYLSIITQSFIIYNSKPEMYDLAV